KLGAQRRAVSLDRLIHVLDRDPDVVDAGQHHRRTTLVPVPAFSGFAPELARFHLGFQLRRWPVSLVAGRLEHVEAGVVCDVQTAEVAAPELPIGMLIPFSTTVSLS